ncbi:MAG: hypothetical protein A2020_00240 [Lentisphaerae bacterium GWF2_45_14]|nr:MAG: hypothetical protein A2020_00240 [Lentisphaerae bacterium GWF2_45_14]
MKISVDGKRKFAVCLILVVISALLVGAGKVTGGMRDRVESGKQEAGECREIVETFSSEVPIEHSPSWAKAVSSNPKLFLRICSMEKPRL